MSATCLICGDTPAPSDPWGFSATRLVDHVLVRHREQASRHGVLLFEALGCFGLRAEEDDEDARETGSAPEDSPRTVGAPAGPVLIVEDNDDVREAVAALIETVGFDVRGASNGQEALEMLRSGGELPCIIVLDIMMPVMDGPTFRRRQLDDPALAHIPVVVVTAYGRTLTGETLRGVEILGKPVEFDRLLEVVQDRCLRV